MTDERLPECLNPCFVTIGRGAHRDDDIVDLDEQRSDSRVNVAHIVNLAPAATVEHEPMDQLSDRISGPCSFVRGCVILLLLACSSDVVEETLPNHSASLVQLRSSSLNQSFMYRTKTPRISQVLLLRIGPAVHLYSLGCCPWSFAIHDMRFVDGKLFTPAARASVLLLSTCQDAQGAFESTHNKWTAEVGEIARYRTILYKFWQLTWLFP